MKEKTIGWLLIGSIMISLGMIGLWICETIKWSRDSQHTIKNIKNTKEIVSQKGEVIPENSTESSFLRVDFNPLKTVNPEVIGWIKVPGTNIDYPFVQTTNNQYYLIHSFDRSLNYGGWVWLDYRNHFSELDRNNILYAHNRKDKTLFGTLHNVLSSKWYSNPSNYEIKISGLEHNTIWRVFSFYIIQTENYYIQSDFTSDQEYQLFLDTIVKRSRYSFNEILTIQDKIVTLSTCDSKDHKMVVHAKLIRQEKRT